MTDGEPPAPDATPAARPRLWNPNAAANWSLLFTPIFGAYLHAANWRALGKPERAKVNVAWVLAGVFFLAVNFAALLVPESAMTAQVLRFGGVGLLVSWYFGQGRPQAKYVRETYGRDYDRRGWGVPLLCAVAGTLAYLGAVVGAVAALEAARPTAADDLAARVKPIILAEIRKVPGRHDATIEALTLAHEGGETYAGTVDATVAGRPRKFDLKVVKRGTSFDWEVVPSNPEFGTLLTYRTNRLYYTPAVTAAEAARLGDFLVKSEFFSGRGRVVQLSKTGPTYQLRVEVSAGFDRDGGMVAFAGQLAGEASAAVFDSAPTEVHLCDDGLVTLRVVPAQ